MSDKENGDDAFVITPMNCNITSAHQPHFWPLGDRVQHHCEGVEQMGELDGHDPVNHPKHYTSHPSGVECITITRHMNFNLGNVLKYIWRAGVKDEAPTIQDLEKAAWYLNDEIERRKKEEQND